MKLSERYFQSLFPKTILLVLLFMANQVFPTTTPARPSVSDSALAIKLYTLALESTRNGIFDSVEVWLNEALPIFKKEGDWKYQTESYYLLSGLNYRTGQAGQAAQYLDTASYLLSAHTDSSNFLYAPYYHHRATVFYVMGNYPEAKKLFLQAIEAYKSYPDEQSQKVINSYNNLGLTFVNLSDYENAVAYLQKCLDLNIKYKSDNNYLIGRSHNNLGMAYYRKGGSESERFDYDYFGKESFRKAEIHYQAALENYLQVLSPPNIALGQCYLNLATVASAKNDLPACIEYNKQALINFGEGSNTPFPHIADVYYNTGIAFKAAGQMDSAYHYVSKAINSGTLFYGKKHRYLSDYYNYRGRVCMEIDNYDEALSDFQQALIITCINFDDTSFLSNPKISNILLKEEAMRCFAWKASALVDKYKHSQNTNDLKMAVENYYHFNDLVKIILSEFNTEEAKLSFMQSVQENYGYIMNLCYQLYAISPNKKYLEDALFFSENEKSATLSAYIDQSVAREIAGISPEEIENEKNAQDKRLKFESQYKNLRADNTSDSTMLDAVADSLLEARYQCELLASQINQKNKKYALQNLTQQPIKIREVQSLLATKNAAAVEYFLLDTAVYIIAVDKDDYIFHRENIDSTFYTQLSDYRKSISDYHFISSNPQEAYQSYTHLALELYNLLFPEAIRPLVEQNQKIFSKMCLPKSKSETMKLTDLFN